MPEPTFLEVKQTLYRNPKIQVRRSSVHRWGLFATEDIKCHEILEEAPYFSVSSAEVDAAPSCEVYTYWLEDGFCLIGMGYAGLYNHCFEPNADYHIDKVSEVITHYAIKDINAGDELFINYGTDNAASFGCTLFKK